MDSTASSTSKVTVTYWDPSSVFTLLSPELRERLPLRNLHWKSPSRPLRSIHSLNVDLVPAIPAQSLAPTSDPSSSTNNATSPSPVGSAALSRTQSTDSTNSMPAATTQHKSSSSLSVSQGSKGSTSTPNLNSIQNTQLPGKERRHQIPGLRQTPYLKIYFIRCDDNDRYRNTARKQLKEWIAQNCTSAGAPPASSSASGSSSSGGGSSSSGKGDRHDAFEWLVVHVVLPGTAAAAQPRLSGTSSSNRSSSPGGSGSSSRWQIKSSSTIIEKIRNDVSAATKKSTSRVVQLRLTHPSPSPPPGAAVTATPLPTPQEKEADYASLISHMKSLILSSFDSRVQQYEDDIIAKSNQQHLPGWNFCTFFLLKEGLAGAFESVGLLEDAGTIYHELAVAGELVVRGEEKGREGGGTFLGWSSEAVKTLVAEGRRWNRRKKKIRESEYLSTGIDIQDEEEMLNEESSILSSTRKPYRELILSSNISVFDFLCYVFTRQIALLMSLASHLPVATLPMHPSTAGSSFSVADTAAEAAASATTSSKGGDGTEGHTAYLADVVRRGIEFLRMAGAVLRAELWAAWESLENPKDSKRASYEGPKDENGLRKITEEDRIPREYAHILINNIVSSFITTGTLHLLNATEHPQLPQLNTNLMLREMPLSPPPTPSVNDHFGESPHKLREPSPQPSMRQKSATIYTDTGKGLGIAKDSKRRPEVEELAGVRAEAVGLAKGIVLELAGGRYKWNQDKFKEMPAPEEEMVEIDLNGDTQGDAASVNGTSIGVEKDGWLWLWGIRNRSLRHAIESEEGFLQVFERMSEIGLKLCTVASRKKSAERILADLATLRFHANDYETAVRYFQELTPFYTSQGWSLIESSLLSIYAICLKKMDRYDEYFAVVVQLLRKHASDEKIRLQAIMQSSKPAYLQQRYYGDPEEDLTAADGGMSPVSVRSTHHHSASLLSIVKELSEKINPAQLSMETLFADLMVDPFPTYCNDGASWRARVKWRWLLTQEILLMNGKLTLAILDGKTVGGSKEKEIVLECKGDVIVRKGRGGAWFDCSMILPSRYQPIKLQLSINNITFTHSFHNDHPPLLIYPSPLAPSVSLHLPKTISLDKVRNVEVRVDTGEATVLEAELCVKSMTAGLRIMIGDSWLIDSPNQEKKVTLDLGHAGEGVLVLKPDGGSEDGLSNCRLGIPYKSDGDLNELSVQLELSYRTSKGSFSHIISPSIFVSLPLAVNVQDVFKKDALFSKFQVSAASHVPLRVMNTLLSSSESYQTECGLGISDALTVFPKQPSNFLYKITRKFEKPTPEIRKPLTLSIEYRTLTDEVELAILTALRSHLASASLSHYSFLLCSALSKKLRNLPSNELDSAALVNTARLGTWEEYSENFGPPLEGIPATNGEREKVIACLKDFFRVEETEEEKKIDKTDIRASGELEHDGTVKRKKKKVQKRIPLLPLYPKETKAVDSESEVGLPKDTRVVDITRSINIPVEIPALQVLCTARMELYPKGTTESSLKKGEPLMVTLGEAIPAKLYISYTRAWDPKAIPRTITALPRSESPTEMDDESPLTSPAPEVQQPRQQQQQDTENKENPKEEPKDEERLKVKEKKKKRRSARGGDPAKGPLLSLFYDITTTTTLAVTSQPPAASPNTGHAQQQQQPQIHNDWLLSGKRRATFAAYEDEETVFNMVLMPLRAGYLLYPGVEVKGATVPVIVEGERRGSTTIIKDNGGGLTFTCETDYRSAASEVLVIAEVSSTTVKIQQETIRPGSSGNLSGVVEVGGEMG